LTSVAAVAQSSRGDDQVLIHGFVTGVNGDPVALATVEMRDLHGETIGSNLTDHAGSFAISAHAKPGQYVLLAAKEMQFVDAPITLDQPDVAVRITVTGSPMFATAGLEDNAVSVQQLRTPEKVRAFLKSASREFAKFNIAAAEQEVERALQFDNACPAAYVLRSFLRIASRDFNGAIEDAKRAALLSPYDANAYLAQATAYNSMTRFPDAERASAQALRLRPDLWQARLELAKTTLGQGRIVLAWRELEELRKDFPDVHLVRAKVLVGLHRGGEAAEEFNRFVQEAPDDPRNKQIQRMVTELTQSSGVQ
jgi:tetratricopeptide (TPR) repeat protein